MSEGLREEKSRSRSRSASAGAPRNGPRRVGSKGRISEVCGVCFAFATDDAAELNAHSEACFALAAQREAGAAPAAEAHFRRFLAHRALPLIQSSAVLLTLTSLGTSVRMALALTSPRWARTSSALGYLPMLHSVSRNGPPPIAAQQLAANAEAVARSIIRLVLPLFALVRLPVMLALFVCSTSPSWREWYISNHARVFTAALLVETFASTIVLEGVVWLWLQRVVVWPPAMIITSTFGDIIAHHMLTLPLRPYMCIMLLRMVTMNAAVFAVPWWPVHARAVWPNCLQAAVQLVCLLHAPRQIRLIRERWAHTATRTRTHEE